MYSGASTVAQENFLLKNTKNENKRKFSRLLLLQMEVQYSEARDFVTLASSEIFSSLLSLITHPHTQNPHQCFKDILYVYISCTHTLPQTPCTTGMKCDSIEHSSWLTRYQKSGAFFSRQLIFNILLPNGLYMNH